MGVDRFYRKVSGPSAAWRDTINCLKGTLSADEGGGGIYAVANPLGADVIVTKAIIDITSACSESPVTFDAGCDAADATTSSDTLMNEVTIGTPTGTAMFNSADNGGSNGALSAKWESGKYFTISASATPTGIAGSVYIYYRKA